MPKSSPRNKKPRKTHLSTTSAGPQNFRYFDLIMALFVTVILCSNLIGAAKVCYFFGISFTGAVLFFPISYLFGDILTEVYGFKRSRKVVWTGFGAMIFASFVSFIIIRLPAAPGWENQSALEIVFAQTPRIAVGSLIAYFVGEFTNSYIIAIMKVKTKGKGLWLRMVGSTVVGEGVDTLIFYPIAFYGAWSNTLLVNVMLTNYVLKVLWEVFMTPVTIKLVKYLKRVEQVDYYDTQTNFSPFARD